MERCSHCEVVMLNRLYQNSHSLVRLLIKHQTKRYGSSPPPFNITAGGALHHPVQSSLQAKAQQRNRNMPPTQTSPSSATTFLLFAFLLLCLFPAAFHSLWTFPLTLVGLYSPDAARSRSSTPPSSDSTSPTMSTAWFQKQFTLPSKSRGSYLITDEVVRALPEISGYKVGILHLFMQHTSCALSLNENWDSDVREDMSDALDRIAPEEGPQGEALYRHDAEGPDDMPVRREFFSLRS